MAFARSGGQSACKQGGNGRHQVQPTRLQAILAANGEMGGLWNQASIDPPVECVTWDGSAAKTRDARHVFTPSHPRRAMERSGEREAAGQAPSPRAEQKPSPSRGKRRRARCSRPLEDLPLAAQWCVKPGSLPCIRYQGASVRRLPTKYRDNICEPCGRRPAAPALHDRRQLGGGSECWLHFLRIALHLRDPAPSPPRCATAAVRGWCSQRARSRPLCSRQPMGAGLGEP